jgi:hypothetical protein
MTAPIVDALSGRGARVHAWLERPLSNFWCFVGWLCATGVFFALAGVLGGPSEGDVSETVYGTWSISHGDLACVYPLAAGHHINDLASPFALAAPLYPVVSAGLAALLRIGYNVAFPTTQQFGPHCDRAFTAMFNWSTKSDAILPTIRLSYFVWFVLMAGVVAILRASGRGRRGWEPAALVLVAATPPVLMCLTFYFHPQDLLAMGLLLVAGACVLKKSWFWAGVFLGLAFCSQQFVVLVGVPLLVIVPASRRLRFAGSALLAIVIIDVPLIVATSGRGLKTVLFGSSRVGSDIRSTSGTVLWETDLHGALLFLISRVLPIVVAAALAWWVSKRLGPHALDPIPLMSLVATSLVLRLVFEENLFGYYFMAAAVTLIVLDAVCGRLREPVVAWLILVTAAFNPVHIGLISNLTSWSISLFTWIPTFLIAIVLASVVVDALRRRIRIYKILLAVVIALTSVSNFWGMHRPLVLVPGWLWQLILVPIALALAVTPLIKSLRPEAAAEPPVMV